MSFFVETIKILSKLNKNHLKWTDPAIVRQEPHRQWTQKLCARTALAAGISTPISFELVQAGNRQGVINEHISGKTRTELTAEEPEKAEEMDGILAEISQALQHAPAAETTMPVQATQMLWFERTFGNRFAGYNERYGRKLHPPLP